MANHKNIQDDEEFASVFTSAGTSKLVVVDYNATWCGPCQKIHPIYVQMAKKYPNALFLGVDIDRCRETAMAQNVSSLPTFIFYRNATKIDQMKGADATDLENMIKKHYGSGDSAEQSGSGGFAEIHPWLDCDEKSTLCSFSRPPTFKEYGDTIKRLEHDNFQLKMRIYMHESKHGKSTGNIKEFEEQFKERLRLKEIDSDRQVQEYQELKNKEFQEELEDKEFQEELMDKKFQELKDKEYRELKDKFDETCEDLATKCSLISSLEELLKDKNELATHLDLENSKLKDKIIKMTEALKTLGYRHADEEAQHSTLKIKHAELMEEYEKTCNKLEQLKRKDCLADHKIDAGVDRLDESLKSNSNHSDQEKIKALKLLNKDLANKLRQTKLALDKTLERLNKTEMDKEQVEKAVCRQLHRTHGILRAARKNLENPAEPALPLNEIN